MERIEELQYFVKAIIGSYETRVRTVDVLMRQTVQWLKNLQAEQEKMTLQLRDHLAKAVSLRKKDFDKMMEGIHRKAQNREKAMRRILERFQKEEEEMVAELKRILASENHLSPPDFRIIKQNILDRQKQREKEVGEILRSFHLDQEELLAALRRLLSKGKKIKIKDFKAMIKGLQAHHSYRESEVARVLEEIERISEQVDAAWQRVMLTAR